MPEDDSVTAQFEASRPRLQALAYRILGSRTDAEDAVQETWLRLARTDPTRIDNLGGWLTTVIARVCLDRLRARQARPEDAAGAIPVELMGAADSDDPSAEALTAESVGAALIMVLDLLAPAERVAFVLHDVFAVPFDEIAPVVDRSPQAARQLASRARRRLQGNAAMGDVDLVRQRQVVDAFLRAARGGDFDALLSLLDPEVVLRPDPAALRMGSLQETHGAAAVASSLAGGARSAQLAIIDGLTGFAWTPGGRLRGVVQFTITNGKIVALDVTGDVERLRQLDIVLLDTDTR
jgi:RNA polymerase sigma-70 factor (ECF subfamily)